MPLNKDKLKNDIQEILSSGKATPGAWIGAISTYSQEISILEPFKSSIESVGGEFPDIFAPVEDTLSAMLTPIWGLPNSFKTIFPKMVESIADILYFGLLPIITAIKAVPGGLFSGSSISRPSQTFDLSPALESGMNGDTVEEVADAYATQIHTYFTSGRFAIGPAGTPQQDWI